MVTHMYWKDELSRVFLSLETGPQFPSRVLMEKLHQGVRVLDSRIESFVRTNSTLFESQLEAIVEQQLTPIRRVRAHVFWRLARNSRWLVLVSDGERT